MVYKVTFQRADREIETLYWEGLLEETISLARSVASECGFEEFRIIESGGSGTEVSRNDYLRRSIVELGLSEAISEGGMSPICRGCSQPSS
jgi:hypothetical protein